MTESTPPRGFVAQLLDEESRLPERLVRVLRFEGGVFAEIESDAHAMPGAFTVVLVTAVAVGLGRPSIPEIFLGVAGAIFIWGASSALIWAIGTLVSSRGAEYTQLLRAAGFAFVWNALAIGASLPLIGGLIEWVTPPLWAGSLILATRHVFDLSLGVSAAVVLVALFLPFAALLLAL